MAPSAATNMIKLNNGMNMPQLGFGTWQAAPGVVGASLETAVKVGFRHIDCAHIYRNQPECGAAFKKLFDEKVVTREDLFITTKLWNTDHHPNNVEAACRLSLKELGLEYLDLYLIHWPCAWKHPQSYENTGDFFPGNADGGMTQEEGVTLGETWAAMEKLVDLGLVKAIGVSNYSLEQIAEIKQTWRIPPAVNQVEVQPFLPNRELIETQRELYGIEVTAYCPLGVGFGTGQEAVDKGVFQHPKIQEIAAEAGISGAALCLQWNLAKGNIVLSKSTNADRIAQNVSMPVGALSADIVAKVDALFPTEGKEYKRRVCNPGAFGAKAGPHFIDAFAQ